MRPAIWKSRRGMTLPELLIVVAIIGLLAVTVLPALATTSEARRSRETARLVSGYCARAQGAAIGQPDWTGLMIMPAGSAALALDLRLARVPVPYTGAVLNAKLAVQTGTATTGSTNGALPASACPVASGTTATASPLELSDIATASVTSGDMIQFDGAGPLYEVTTITSGTVQFRIRDSGSNSAGFSTVNQSWPAATPATHAFEIFRQPVPKGQPFEIPNSRVIDLGWSGYGPSNDPNATSYTALQSAVGQTVSIVFDSTGRMRLIMRGSTRVTPQHPVYLLVGRPDRVGNTYASTLSPTDDSLGANWQYADSWWIAIDPLTGTVRSAECQPNSATVTGSQKFIREQL
jgi:prepilin-type N-terminal cleavage/methylation domain-containing protein